MSLEISYRKQGLMIIFGLLIVFVVVELAAQFWWYNIETCAFEQSDVYADLPPETKRQMCIQTYEVQYSVTKIDPNQHYDTININSEGFRGKEISILKPDNTFRIFVVGGSTVYGTGAESDIKTIPGFLQQEFDNSEINYNVEIINAGISGAWSYTSSLDAKNKLVNFEPDMMVIYGGWNDLTRFSDSATDDAEITSWTNIWKDRWLEVCEIGNEKNFQTIITLEPFIGTGNKKLTEEEFSWFLKNDHPRMLKLYDSYTQQLPELDNVCTKTADLGGIFDDYEESIFWDSTHVGNKGNSIIAKNLFKIIVPQLPNFIVNTPNKNNISTETSVQETDRNIFLDDIIYVAKKNILPYYKTPIAIKHIFLSTGEMSFKADISKNMNNHDFTEQNLSGIDFSQSYLSEIVLTEKNLSGTNFSQSYLSNADLSNADLSNADLSYSNLSNADLSYSNLSNADLTGSIFVGADLSNADLTNAKLQDTDLRNTNLKYSNLSFVDLSSSKIVGADARNSNLSNAILQSHHLSDSFFDGANLSNADLTFTIFRNVGLSGANLSGANISYADLTYANLEFSNLSRVKLIGSDLSGANLSNANLQNSNLSSSNLFNTDFTNANLEDMIVKNTNLSCINHEICN